MSYGDDRGWISGRESEPPVAERAGRGNSPQRHRGHKAKRRQGIGADKRTGRVDGLNGLTK